jgi:uncharacterized membrane protein
MLVTEATGEKVLDSLEEFGGKLYQTSFSHEDQQKIHKALENEKLREAAVKSTDLD